jgi:hypothetical protein
MTIHTKKQKLEKIQINLSKPEGNAFDLIAVADSLGKQLRKSPEERAAIRDEMMSSDYDHLVAVLDKHYGMFIDIYEQ